MQVTDQMIDNLSNLSKLQFSNEEKKIIASDLEKMIAFVNKLQELDTEGIKPLQHMSNVVNVLRNDEVKELNVKSDLMQEVPHTDGVFIKVPKIIQKTVK